MHGQNFVINKSSNWHAVKYVLELFPKADGVATLALIVEAIDTINLAALVIASQQEEVFLEFHFIGEQKNDGLKRLLATVDVIAKEQVVGLWWEASILEEAEQISKLSVHITYKIMIVSYTKLREFLLHHKCIVRVE